MTRFFATILLISAISLTHVHIVNASLVTAGDFLEAEGLSLQNFLDSVEENLSGIQTAIDGLGGGYSPTSLGSIGGDIFAAGDPLRQGNFMAAADFLEAEGLSLQNFLDSVEGNLSGIHTAIDGLGGGYSPSSLGSIGGDIFAAGDPLRQSNFMAAGDFLEAEGLSLQNFLDSVEENLSGIHTAIDGLGGGYSPSSLGSIGGDIFAAGEELNSVPEPSGGVQFLILLAIGGAGAFRKTKRSLPRRAV